MDPSDSVLVRHGGSVHGSGKLQHHQPLSRVADMIPVSGRIELRPRKGEGSMGEGCHQRVYQPIWGANASRPSRSNLPGTIFFSSLGSGQRGRCPPLLWGRTASAPKYVDFRRPGSTVVIHFYFLSLQWSTSTVLRRGVMDAAVHVAALLSPVLVAERAPRVITGTPQADTPITLTSTPLQ